MLARLADGGMRDALSLLDQCSAQEHIDVEAVLAAMGLAGSRRTAELLQAVANGDTAGALGLFHQLWKDGKDPAAILDELAGLMRDVLLLQVAPNGCDALLSGSYERAVLERFAAKIPGPQLMDFMNAIRGADLSGSDPRRASELCLVALCVPETGDSLEALRNRVSRLEAALRSGAVPAAAAPVPAPAAKAETRPDPAPAPVFAPPAVEEGFPWYTDEDAPPENPEFIPPAPPAQDDRPAPKPEPKPEPVFEHEPAPVFEPAPEPAPAPVSSPAPVHGGGDIWDALVKRLNGKLNMGAYAMIATASQAGGDLVGNTMTVYLTTPIAKLMLDTPATVSLFQQELQALTGQNLQVVFSDQPRPAPKAPDTGKLDELSRFSNVTFE